tara:strand:+ start:17095 stop:17448 length:354 start_codon:yes stop_codon:yes gene_type:complete
MEKKWKYIKEYLEYKSDLLGIDLGDLATVDDGYYKMDLYDVDYLDQSGEKVILKVKFSEINNPEYSGEGTFKYIHSDIPGFSDVSPIDIRGILDDVFEESPENVIDLLHQIYDQIKY